MPTYVLSAIVILTLLAALLLLVAYGWLALRLLRKRAYVAGMAMLVLPLVAHEAHQYHWYVKAIPEQIGVTYPISMSDETGFREGCGTMVFKLSDDTLAKMRKDGLAFFATAIQGRGHPGERYYRYDAWKETPVPPSWTDEGSWMLCSGLSRAQHAAIIAAATSRGAYYTTKDEAQVVVIPSLGYIVYSFFG